MILHWRHNGCDGVSNHQPHDCFTQAFIQTQIKKHQSSASLAFVRGIHWWPVNSPHKGPVRRKTFPFDDVIMTYSQENISNVSWVCVFYPFGFRCYKMNIYIWIYIYEYMCCPSNQWWLVVNWTARSNHHWNLNGTVAVFYKYAVEISQFCSEHITLTSQTYIILYLHTLL